MKKKLLLALTLILLSSNVNAQSLRFNGCREVCYSETISYPVNYQVTEEIRHREYWTEEKAVERFVKNPVVKGEHDCLNYKTWDEIANDIDNGRDIGYYLKDGKLYKSNGKRYLRCNDPDNPFNFKKIVDKIIVTHYNDWTEYINVNKSYIYSHDVLNCYYIYDHQRYRHDDGDRSAPVPEPTTMVLFNTGLAGLAYKMRKK